MKTVYVLEDDLKLASLIEEFLFMSSFQVKTFSDYRLFFDEIRKRKPDIILLDLMLPMVSGVEVLKYLKGNLIMHNIPVLVVSGINDENEKVECLDLGADDYISKPFGFHELVSRINAVLRRFGNVKNLTYENLEIDKNNRTVLIDGKLVILTRKEYDLLLYLIERIDMIVSKEELLHRFWSESQEHSRSIDMHIKALRQKIFMHTKLEIQTILKVGYKLVKLKEN